MKGFIFLLFLFFLSISAERLSDFSSSNHPLHPASDNKPVLISLNKVKINVLGKAYYNTQGNKWLFDGVDRFTIKARELNLSQIMCHFKKVKNLFTKEGFAFLLQFNGKE